MGYCIHYFVHVQALCIRSTVEYGTSTDFVFQSHSIRIFRPHSSVYSEKRTKEVTKCDRVDHLTIESRHTRSLRDDLASMMVVGVWAREGVREVGRGEFLKGLRFTVPEATPSCSTLRTGRVTT